MSELSGILEKYPPQTRVRFRIKDTPFILMTNRAELAKELGKYMALWSKEAAGETGHLIYAIVGEYGLDRDRLVDVQRSRQTKAVKEAFYDIPEGRVVLKKRTGVVVLQEKDAWCIIGDLMANLNQVVNVIDELYVADYLRKGYLLLHASAVVDRQGGGIAFTSESGTGKSTMAVAMLEHGFHYISNDRLLVRTDGEYVEMLGVPKKPRLNPGTMLALPRLHELLSHDEILRYSELTAEELWNLEDKHDLEVDEVFGAGTTIIEGKLVTCFLLEWKRGAGRPSIRKMTDDRELMRCLVPQVVNMDPLRKQTALSHMTNSLLDEIIRRIGFYYVTGGVDVIWLARHIAGARGSQHLSD